MIIDFRRIKTDKRTYTKFLGSIVVALVLAYVSLIFLNIFLGEVESDVSELNRNVQQTLNRIEWDYDRNLLIDSITNEDCITQGASQSLSQVNSIIENCNSEDTSRTFINDYEEIGSLENSDISNQNRRHPFGP